MGNIFSISMSCNNVATLCWNDCIRGRALYICNLEENLVALDQALQELKAKRDDVMREVTVAEQQPLMKRKSDVQLWLSTVAAEETAVAGLIKDGPQEIERLCLGGYCSKNCKSTYKFGKMVAQKLEYVNALKSKGDHFEVVAERVPAGSVDARPSEPTVGLDTIFDKVWSCLEDENVETIGLYGTGGVGKTTLLKKINSKFVNTPHNFHFVIWVVVSNDLKIEKIQEAIGKKLGFSDDWKCKSHDEKVVDIFNVLSNKKFILLLDDIWERVDLNEVGIPQPNIQNGSKVVFTSRSEKVCHQMKAQKKIKVECLAWEKAWELFQEKVGEETLDAHPDIPKLAEIVAKKCGGLPLALITTGLAMTCRKTPQEWKHAIKVLKRNAAEFSGMEDKVFPILKFSYDNLRNDKVRSCFLYCALFPEDYLFYKVNLIDFWIGEEFLDAYDDRREAENEGYDIISTLLQASLLEYEDLRVKMHDVIRDLALWITSECGKVKDNYLVEAGARLTEVPDVRKWKSVRRMSLRGNHIENLTETPQCPNLLTLFLSDNRLKMIVNEFFQFMPSLKVLDLSENADLKELPLGISELVSLEHLNLSYTGIRRLPIELKTLVSLKYLNLANTDWLTTIPQQLISSFSMLQVLRIFYVPRFNKVVKEGILSGDNELLIKELQCLKHLSTLSLNIRSESTLQRFLSFQKSQSCIQALCLDTFSGSEKLDVSSLANMKRLERLDITRCGSLEKLIQVPRDLHNSVILTEICFNSLCYVNLTECPKLVDLTWLILAPNLLSLYVKECGKMEQIISVGELGEVPNVVGNLNPFAKLERIVLYDLPKLKSIYRTALPFPHLSEIDVRNCPKLKKLPLNSNSVKEHKIVIYGYEGWGNELEWEDEATQKVFLPCFTTVLD